MQHHSQRKQLEVLQTRTPNGGSIQLVRSQTIQSSRWSSSNVHKVTSNGGGVVVSPSRKHGFVRFTINRSLSFPTEPCLSNTMATQNRFLLLQPGALPSTVEMKNGVSKGPDLMTSSTFHHRRQQPNRSTLINGELSGGLMNLDKIGQGRRNDHSRKLLTLQPVL